jgi:hypothetical protein
LALGIADRTADAVATAVSELMVTRRRILNINEN